MRIGVFGNFGGENFGNDLTLLTVLSQLRRLAPDAALFCVCADHQYVADSFGVEAIPMSATLARRPQELGATARWLWRLFVGAPSEVYRWLCAFRALKGARLLIVPGTGLLTDSFGLAHWGPYGLFRWALIARLRGCKVLFVSVGAGPIDTWSGRLFVRWALSLASFRSYRDRGSRDCIRGTGLQMTSDSVYPDVVFALGRELMPAPSPARRVRPVVALGVMSDGGMYGRADLKEAYEAYMDSLVPFVEWLLAHEYDVRIVIGDTWDRHASHALVNRLRQYLRSYGADRMIERPIASSRDLLAAMAEADLVVATRFHNVLLALVLGKPVVSIAFHEKCTALMSAMGLARYCEDIGGITGEKLIARFLQMEADATTLRPVIEEQAELARELVNRQCGVIASYI